MRAKPRLDLNLLCGLGLVLTCFACSAADVNECAPLDAAPEGKVNVYPLALGKTWEYTYTYSYSHEYSYPFINQTQTGEIRAVITDIGPCNDGWRTIQSGFEVTYDDVVRFDSSNGNFSYDSTSQHVIYTYHWSDRDGDFALAGGWPDFPAAQQYSNSPSHQIQRIQPSSSDVVTKNATPYGESWSWTYASGKGLVEFFHDTHDKHAISSRERWLLRSVTN